MRFIALAAAMVVFASALTAGTGNEAKSIEGTWKLVKAIDEDRTLPPLNNSVTFQDGKFTTNLFEEAGQEGRYKIDGTKKPAQIDLIHTAGPYKGKTSFSIFKLEGKKLTICLGAVGAPEAKRPTAFAAKKGTNDILLILEKTK